MSMRAEKWQWMVAGLVSQPASQPSIHPARVKAMAMVERQWYNGNNRISKAAAESVISLIYGLKWCFYLAMQPKRKTLITSDRRYMWFFFSLFFFFIFAISRIFTNRQDKMCDSAFFAPVLYCDISIILMLLYCFRQWHRHQHRHHTIASHITCSIYRKICVFVCANIVGILDLFGRRRYIYTPTPSAGVKKKEKKKKRQADIKQRIDWKWMFCEMCTVFI